MALQKMMDRDTVELPKTQAISNSSFKKAGNRPQFLKGIYKDGKVTILEGQSSAMLQTFAISNALVYLPSDQSEIKMNDQVEVILLPI